LNHEATKGTKKKESVVRHAQNLHRNNLAEWLMAIAVVYPAWLGVATWNRVRRFVPFVTSWFNKKN
jgi:hypothetical protein